MPEYPVVVLPLPVPARKRRKSGGPSNISKPSRDEQGARIGPKLNVLAKHFEGEPVRLATVPELAPFEEVLVLEVAGLDMELFSNAVHLLEGFEFLSELDEYDLEPTDTFAEIRGADERVTFDGRVYLVMANQEAIRELLNLWGLWQGGRDAPRGLTRWYGVFSMLRDIRKWSSEDRIAETGVRQRWEEAIVGDNVRSVHCEIELWYRASLEDRDTAERQVVSIVDAFGGTISSRSDIPQIRYHALCVEVPRESIEAFLQDPGGALGDLVQFHGVHRFRVAGQLLGTFSSEGSNEFALTHWEAQPGDLEEPRVALIDGLPMQNHRSLEGRLLVDDPHDVESMAPVSTRLHGTAMSSLIVWGDQHSTFGAIPSRLLVRPILVPDSGSAERIPSDSLVVDEVHQAVVRIVAGREEKPPSVGHRVVAINFSVGIPDTPFLGEMSPLGRLLDWLAWEHSLLFIVSAGNYGDGFNLRDTWGTLKTLPSDELSDQLVEAALRENRTRRLLSPAESINSLSVGALSFDHDPIPPSARRRVGMSDGGISLFGAQGPGFRRSIKPDFLAPGGRFVIKEPLSDNNDLLEMPEAGMNYSPGQLVSVPDPAGISAMHVVSNRGTSNSAAIVSRESALLLPAIEELRARFPQLVSREVSDAVLLKAFLAHRVHETDSTRRIRDLAIRALGNKRGAIAGAGLAGYGAASLTGSIEGDPFEITCLGTGALKMDEGAIHSLPLPPGLSGLVGEREVSVTLAWFSPVNPASHRWRKAQLWFHVASDSVQIGSQGRLSRLHHDWQAVRRGTLQHEVFAGTRAIPITTGDSVDVHVSCCKDAGQFPESIPYALLVSLRVAPELGVEIYSEVSALVRAQVGVGVRAPA